MITKFDVNERVLITDKDGKDTIVEIKYISVGTAGVRYNAVGVFDDNKYLDIEEKEIKESYGVFDEFSSMCIGQFSLIPDFVVKDDVSEEAFVNLAMLGVSYAEMVLGKALDDESHAKTRNALSGVFNLKKKWNEIMEKKNEVKEVEKKSDDDKDGLDYEGLLNYRVAKKFPQWARELFSKDRLKKNSDGSVSIMDEKGKVIITANPGERIVPVGKGYKIKKG